MEKDETKLLSKKQTYELKLTKLELLHLRDIFSVLMPPDLKVTLSQMLASAAERSMVETLLWNKVVNLCTTAEIPLGDDAPDFVVSYSGPPVLGVFQLASDDSDHDHDDDQDDADSDEKKNKLLFE